MDFEFTPEEEAWREEVRAFLDAELPPEQAFDVEFDEDEDRWRFAFEFSRKVAAKGWIGLTWPVEYGGLGRSVTDRLILEEELIYREAPLVNAVGWSLVAGALLHGGTHEQKAEHLPPMARGETFWCEGFSEPDSGSDLASLTTTAVRDGDHWVIDGQKTYTTWGHFGDLILLAARTDGRGRHRGITLFGVDMSLPGISMSPLWNIAGGRQNHTYFDGVRVPDRARIGAEGAGWDLIMNAFYAGRRVHVQHAHFQQMLDKVVGYCRATERAGRPLIEDPFVRDKLAELARIVETQRLLTYEALSDVVHERPPKFAGALPSVVHKEAQPRVAQLISQIVGPLGQLSSASGRAPLGGQPDAWYRASYANHAGGTPQVKRMVLATRGLGLPR